MRERVAGAIALPGRFEPQVRGCFRAFGGFGFGALGFRVLGVRVQGLGFRAWGFWGFRGVWGGGGGGVWGVWGVSSFQGHGT